MTFVFLIQARLPMGHKGGNPDVQLQVELFLLPHIEGSWGVLIEIPGKAFTQVQKVTIY